MRHTSACGRNELQHQAAPASTPRTNVALSVQTVSGGRLLRKICRKAHSSALKMRRWQGSEIGTSPYKTIRAADSPGSHSAAAQPH
eukprot:6730573-Karenia_brevis.AAC.1